MNQYIVPIVVIVIALVMLNVIVWIIQPSLVQMENCQVLMMMFDGGDYTREELLSDETFDFSYYWGLQNGYWNCDTWYDKEQTIERLVNGQ